MNTVYKQKDHAGRGIGWQEKKGNSAYFVKSKLERHDCSGIRTNVQPNVSIENIYGNIFPDMHRNCRVK